MAPVKLQVFTKDGGVLTKSITLKDGKLVKDGNACKMYSGTVETVTVESMQALADLFARLELNQAIGLGTTDYSYCELAQDARQQIVTKQALDQNPGAIARGAEFFRYEPGQPAPILIDRDGSDGDLMTRARALQMLGEAVPDFDGLGVLVTDSSSSYISTTDGVELSGEGNHHTYLVAKDGADIPRFTEAFEGHLWLKGYGRPCVTRSGAYLSRTVFDKSVHSPERLVFEAGAKLGPGLVQRRPAPWVREGAMFDTRLLPDLTDAELVTIKRMQAECRASVADDVARVRTVYEGQERAKLVSKGKTAEDAERIVADRVSLSLNDDDLLYFDRLSDAITVGEVRAKRDEFINATMADPLEPDYGGASGSVVKGKAQLLARPDGELWIKSFAHGGTNYKLIGELAAEFAPLVDEVVEPTSKPAQADSKAAMLIDRTDSGNVALLAAITAGNLKYVPETKTWLGWTCERWEPDRYGTRAQSAALQVGQHYLDKAAHLRKQMPAGLDAKERKAVEQAAEHLERWANACRNKRGLDSMLGLAKVDSRFALSVAEIDRDPWLFGVDNGVVDLRTGALRGASRDEYVTRRSPIAFNPEAPATRWLQFIEEITASPRPGGKYQPRPQLAAYLQRALGYCLTGSTREHKMFIATGPGANGKSVLLDLLKEIMGDYGEVIAPEALMATKGDADAERATPSARKLAGARTATSSESKDGQKLDVALVKRHTGGGFLTARGMHENAFTFEITHKLWLMTNHKPVLDHMDDAMRGRLHMIPFDMRWNRPGHPERNPNLPDGDKTLTDQLRAESEGVLAWLVAGAVAYQRDGLEPPHEVAGMTRDYFSDQDPFGLWLETCEVCEAAAGTGASDLFNEFRSWCLDEDYDVMATGTQKTFSLKLTSRGVDSQKRNDGKRYGLRAKVAGMFDEEGSNPP